jgi:hypothetical protein
LYLFLDFEQKLVKNYGNYNKNIAKLPYLKEKHQKFAAFGVNLSIFRLKCPKKSEKFQRKESLI